MSESSSQPIQSEVEGLATDRSGDTRLPGGQRHDRILGNDGAIMAMKTIPANAGEVDVEISTGQKMLSAVSGSLLTSLLGTNSTHISEAHRKRELVLTACKQSLPSMLYEYACNHNQHLHPSPPYAPSPPPQHRLRSATSHRTLA